MHKKLKRGQHITKMVISRKKKNLFLLMMAQNGGNVSKAAYAAGFSHTSYLHALRREDEDFADKWDEALVAGCDVLEAEMWRRGHDGIMEPVFYKGEIVSYTLAYSDALLLAMVKARMPDKYRDNRMGGGSTINFGIAVLPITAPNEDSWEQRAVDMHTKQEVIQLEAKPVENTLKSMKRGD